MLSWLCNNLTILKLIAFSMIFSVTVVVVRFFIVKQRFKAFVIEGLLLATFALLSLFSSQVLYKNVNSKTLTSSKAFKNEVELLKFELIGDLSLFNAHNTHCYNYVVLNGSSVDFKRTLEFSELFGAYRKKRIRVFEVNRRDLNFDGIIKESTDLCNMGVDRVYEITNAGYFSICNCKGELMEEEWKVRATN